MSTITRRARQASKNEIVGTLCFLAGANAIFYRPKLLTTPDPGRDRDMILLDSLGMRPMDSRCDYSSPALTMSGLVLGLPHGLSAGMHFAAPVERRPAVA